jgi:hypothetical protein
MFVFLQSSFACYYVQRYYDLLINKQTNKPKAASLSSYLFKFRAAAAASILLLIFKWSLSP